MEELELQEEKSGIFTRLKGIFNRDEEYIEEESYDSPAPSRGTPMRQLGRAHYSITVRRMVQSFQDAVAAADGLKRGDQQVLNLTACDPALRDKIKDFMCGVNYSQEGTWEELGDNVYLLAPPNAMVDVAPATPRVTSAKN
ncbi:MAG: cell division protein SepF [Chthonomonas sp.]|nr:cell division protein SepF [Chthonomonas sp.]